MKKLFVTTLLCLFFIIPEMFAQDVTEPPKTPNYKNHIGIGAGFTTGIGISYRYVAKKTGFQVNVGPYIADHGENITSSFGLTLLRRFVETRTTNFYAYLANSYNYQRKLINANPNYYDIKDSWNTGLGVGFEMDTRKRVVIDLMIGYAQYNTFETLFFTAEMALYYRF
jgi:hypothetical protein